MQRNFLAIFTVVAFSLGAAERMAKMRNSLWTVLILFFALGTPRAHADVITTYDINFTCTSGPTCILPTSGTFTYDATDHLFTNFEVVWDGSTINLEGKANAGPSVQGSNPCLGSATGGAATYLLMTSCPFALYEPWLANSGGTFAFTESYDGNDYSSIRAGGVPDLGQDTQSWGDFTVTATPEPSSFALLGTAVLAFAGIVRRKISR